MSALLFFCKEKNLDIKILSLLFKIFSRRLILQNYFKLLQSGAKKNDAVAELTN